MKILAFDTSTEITAVAVTDGERVLAEDKSPSAERTAGVLLPRIEAQLREAGVPLSAIEAIAVGLGPGSFTGLRAGLATAKGLALALRVPIRGVSSLEVLARAVLSPGALAVPVLDAGRGELFFAAYRAAETSTLPEAVLAPSRAPSAEANARIVELVRGHGRAVLCGREARAHQAELEAALGERAAFAEPSRDLPSAAVLARAALAWLRARGPSDLATLEPAYLRDSDAKLPDEPLAL